MHWSIIVMTITIIAVSMILIGHQVMQFILYHKGALPTNSQIIIVCILYSLFLFNALYDYYFFHKNVIALFKMYFTFGWGMLFCLLDLSNHWLPWRFTQTFWIAGLLFTSIAGVITAALLSSLTVFALLWGIRSITEKIGGKEGLGLGDVLLIAGLFSWFPWKVAAWISAGGFLLVAAYSLLSRCTRQPYAPGVFIVLGINAGLYPEMMDHL